MPAPQKRHAPARPSRAGLTVSRPELLVNGSDRVFRQFVHDMLAFAVRIQEIRNRLGESIGLTGTQYTLLIAIAHEQGVSEVGINEIAQKTHFSPSFVTIEVNRLVAKKLVTKKVNPTDRRRVLLSVTQSGFDLLNSLTVLQQPVNDELFGPLTRSDFDQMRIKIVDLIKSADRTLKHFDYLLPAQAAKSSTTTR